MTIIADLLDRPEYEDQVEIFRWAAELEPQWPCLHLLYGSMMGVKLPIRILNKLIKAGMKKGKPDINLPVPIGGHCGLWIELKRYKGAKPSEKQVEMLVALSAVGNASFHCKGSAAAKRLILNYLTGKVIRTNYPICQEWDPTEPIDGSYINLPL